MTQIRGSNTGNDPGTGTESEADDRVPAAVALASRGDPQNVLPLECLLSSARKDDKPVITYELKSTAVGFGTVQDDPDLLSRR